MNELGDSNTRLRDCEAFHNSVVVRYVVWQIRVDGGVI